MIRNNPVMRGRYWGPSCPGDEKLDPHSPNQSSLLLARINARARARKAAQLNITNGLPNEVQQSNVSNEKSQEKVKQVSNVSASIDEFIRDMRNASSKVEEENSVANDDGTERKKKKKHKEKEADDDNTIHVTVKTETIDDNIKPQVPKKKKKHNSECASEINKDINSLETAGKEESSPCDTQVKRKKKKKQKENKIIIKTEILETSDALHLDRGGGECESREEGEGEMGKKKKKKKKRKELDISHHRENGDVIDGSLNNNLHTPTKIKMEVQEEFVEDTNHVSIENYNHKFIGPQESEACDESRRKKKKKRKQVKDDMEEISNNTGDVNTPAPTIDSSNQLDEELANGEEMSEKEPPKKKKKNNKMELPVADDETREMDVGKETPDEPLQDRKIMLKKAKKIKKKNKKKTARKMEVGGFTLLRKMESVKTEKLHRTLPHWLAHPTCLSRNLQESGEGLKAVAGLASWLRRKLEKNKMTHFFPVQCAVIPEILASAGPLTARYRPRDICVSAPTGSGKTLAFVLPILQALHGRTVPKVRALILLPVQELANQVYKVFETYSRGSGLKIGMAVGQKSFVKEQAGLVGQDYRGQHCLVDILVATPGRLADHLTFTPGLDLSALRYLVLDEADRMLAAEGGEWVARIEQTVKGHMSATSDPASLYAPSPPHRLLFSATLSHDPEQLQHVTLHHPRLFTVAGPEPCPSSGIVGESAGVVVGRYVRPAELSEEYVMVDETVKPLVLYHLISGRAGQEGDAWQKVLVFTNSRAATHRLSVLLACLAPDRSVAEFSSSNGKNEKRQQIVSQFIAGKIDILVSSDAMARGLDIPEIEHVVSYDVSSVNTYVHRIGRTARAGRPGKALSLVTKDMLSEFKAALSSGGEGAQELTMTTEELEPYEEQYVTALAKMKEILQEEEQLRREVLRAGSKRKQVAGGGWAQGKAREKGRKKVKRLQHTWKPVRFR